MVMMKNDMETHGFQESERAQEMLSEKTHHCSDCENDTFGERERRREAATSSKKQAERRGKESKIKEEPS